MDVTSLLLCVLVTLVAAQEDVKSTQKVESFHVVSDIRYRFATTQVVSVVRNTASFDQEIVFGVTLPKEAFIMHFDMAIDGKVYEGEVKEKKAAKRQYQHAIDLGQSAGHVAQKARHANLFDVSVNVAGGSAVNFTLTYQELLRRKQGLYQHEVHVNPGQAVENFLVKVFVKDKVPITLIRTPIKADYLLSNTAEDKAPDSVSVLQRDPTTAYIEYAPSLTEQGPGGINARFLLEYDVDHNSSGDLLVVDGYFVNFYAPSVPPMNKDIVFVLDKSGSMMGRKIQQLKTAMKSILKDLMPEDRFNIISFSDGTFEWKPVLSKADNDVKAEAINFVNSIGANGGTNMNAALIQAVRSLQQREVKTRAPIVFFLTDGRATSGVTDREQIEANIRSTNEGGVTIVSLAFGNDADYNLLKTVSAQNSGFARKIYEASDSALQVATLYKEISSVSLRHLNVTYMEGSVDEFSLTQLDFPVVFNGSEIIVCGRLDQPRGPFQMVINATQRDGDLSLKFETEDLANYIIGEPKEESNLFNSPRDFGSIVQRMWAFLTIKQMLKEMEKGTSNKTETEQLKQKIIDMAVRYKFVTPLTSMVVTKPEKKGQPKQNVETGLTDVDDVTPDHGRMLSASDMFYSSRQRLQKSSALPKHAFLDMDGLPGMAMGVKSPQGARISSSYTGNPGRRYHSSRRWSQKRRNRKRGKKGNVGRSRKQRKQPKVFLVRIVVESSQGSLCVIPRKWSPGNYSLLETPSKSQNKQYPVILEVTKATKRGISLLSLYLDDGTWVKVNATSKTFWTYGQGRDTMVSVVNTGKGLQLDKSGQKVVVMKVMKQTKRIWFLSVTLSQVGGDGGSKLKKAVRATGKKKATSWCSMNNETFSKVGIVSGRRSKRFFVQ